MESVELQVRLHCKGCERSVRTALCKLKGVDTVDIDIDLHKITVVGHVDQKTVLKTVRKTGRRAELWPFPYQPGYIIPSKTSHPHGSTYTKTYNYRKHGYNRGYNKIADSDQTTSMFSNENPHSCTVM